MSIRRLDEKGNTNYVFQSDFGINKKHFGTSVILDFRSKEDTQEIIQRLSNVKAILEKYDNRRMYEAELIMENKEELEKGNLAGGERLNQYYKDGNSLIISLKDMEVEDLREGEIEVVPYQWGAYGLIANSCKDITEISDGEGNKEYYYTSEIIEALEKWEVLSKKWDDPEERAKMIEEYEKNNS